MGDLVEAFEIMPHDIFAVVERQFPQLPCPPQPIRPYAILMEIASDETLGAGCILALSLQQKLEDFLAKQLEDGLILDAAMAQNETQRKAMWDIREHAPDSTKANHILLILMCLLLYQRLAHFMTMRLRMCAKSALLRAHLCLWSYW